MAGEHTMAEIPAINGSGADVEVGWQPAQWPLPRVAAVDNLADALSAKGFTQGAVRALSQAAVRPDELRRKLSEPAELRVQGGTLLIAETRLWSAAVVPHPANPREYGRRSYALGGAAASLRVLPEPTSSREGLAELEILVESPHTLAQRLEDAQGRLARENPLGEDVAVDGVLQPLTVVPMTVRHRDGHRSAPLLIAADGSSRISAVHDLLGYAPSKVAYEWSSDRRLFRREVNRWIRLVQQQGWEHLSDSEQQKVRVLTVPTRVVIGFRPNERSNLPFHTAVRNFIGLTHIRPPKPYGSAVENEAKADAVLDALAQPTRTRPARITELEKQWFAGVISHDEAVEEGFSPYRDVRAAEIVRSVLGGSAKRRVNDGIRSLTAKQKPTREDRVDIAVELTIRPYRTEMNDLQQLVRPRRAVLQRAYRLKEIEQHLKADLRLEGAPEDGPSLERLRDEALEEVESGLGDSGELGPAQTELAVKSCYYMAVADPMALQREVFGGPGHEDDRSPATVLRAMLSRSRGVYQAYEVVRAGRCHEPLYEVDEKGAPVLTSWGEPRKLTDTLVRHTYNGEPTTDVAQSTGYQAASRRWADVRVKVEELTRAVTAMEAVPVDEGGHSLVQREGWDTGQITELRRILDRSDRRLAAWADVYELNKEAAQEQAEAEQEP
ncbi:hypothetical protein [Streptomyces massasporeus]|uniref:hypothetical protein n=1 Tax=Streptomyces massasporeus TaxID=67324 RepID=UPI001672F519|nr:hypothetical protein [Streptomyces massasporeus]GGV68142.1 hypothetical protein GCM10010228_22230 [Streptomyces massasporeus]